MILGLFIFNSTQNVWLLGIAHIIFWAPLAVYLWLGVIRTSSFVLKSAYGIWVILLLDAVLISLVLDIRDVALVLMGLK